MKRHYLKTDPEVFAAVLAGTKTHEIRKNDRDYAVGDELLLRETTHTGTEIAAGSPLEYTGRELLRTVSHVLTGYGLQDGWCILSFDARTILDPTRESYPEFTTIPTAQNEILRLFRMGLTHLRKCKIADFPDGTVEVNGQFRKFIDSDTDSAWIGFRLALNAARRLATRTLLPMESAPLDGTEVLLRVKRRAGIQHKYLVGHYMPGGYCIDDHPAIGAGWYFWNGSMFDLASEPEGWMPLPDKAADQEEGGA